MGVKTLKFWSKLDKKYGLKCEAQMED